MGKTTSGVARQRTGEVRRAPRRAFIKERTRGAATEEANAPVISLTHDEPEDDRTPLRLQGEI